MPTVYFYVSEDIVLTDETGCVIEVLSRQVGTKRTALVIRGGIRIPQPFSRLKRGDIFVLIEPDGSSVDNGEVCTALGDAYVNEQGIDVIVCRPNTWREEG